MNMLFDYTYFRRYGKYTKKVNGELVKGLYISKFLFHEANRIVSVGAIVLGR